MKEEKPVEIEKKAQEPVEKQEEKKAPEVEQNPEKVEEKPKEVKQIDERRLTREERREKEFKESLTKWKPKTELGVKVRNGEIKHIGEVLDSGQKILESEIVDLLIPIKSDLISIGQSKGKFGGGKRRAWRQTQRKTKEGNVPTFSALAVVGDENGHVGIGNGRSMETLPARDKALRKAKLNIIKIERTCSAFDCSCEDPHTIPFKIHGKAGSVRVTLIPAPQGTGLVVANELKKVLKLAGIQDVYSKTSGRKRTTFNLIQACIDALKKTHVTK